MADQSIWSTERHSQPRPGGTSDKRTAFEQDYDRLLFSTPVRRLADKTQVFPLERNDGVRTRLTHSHEVSNLARSIGNRLLRTEKDIFGKDESVKNAIPVILSTIGLAHDLGNPPFGHQGEAAIGRWFSKNAHLFNDIGHKLDSSGFSAVPESFRNDFKNFEGNAQTIRLISCLQNTSGNSGLNLTAATLAALMKYTASSDKINDSNASTKKFGFFFSEAHLVDWIRERTGLQEGQRHPLTWLMEACDDVAYSVLDIEDAIKKRIISPEDLRAFVKSKFSTHDLGGGLTNQLEKDFTNSDSAETSLSRVQEIKASYIRTRLIERLLTGAADQFIKDKNRIFSYERTAPLLSPGTFEGDLYESLKEFARDHAYKSSSVLKLELEGARIIEGLMDRMWMAITNRKKFLEKGSKRTTPQASYVYSMISDSYRWQFESEIGNDAIPIRYQEMQLLTDMISGMTDGFAVQLFSELEDVPIA
jgi:dGTPase